MRYVLRHGSSHDGALLFARIAAASDDNTVMLPFPIWREAFINDADAELAQPSYAQLPSEPYRCFTDKLDLGAFYASQVPRSYLNCVEAGRD